jgi:hypothetical protein
MKISLLVVLLSALLSQSVEANQIFYCPEKVSFVNGVAQYDDMDRWHISDITDPTETTENNYFVYVGVNTNSARCSYIAYDDVHHRAIQSYIILANESGNFRASTDIENWWENINEYASSCNVGDLPWTHPEIIDPKKCPMYDMST